MKIAIHNPLLESPEVVASKSMIKVGKKLGYDVRIFNYVSDINEFNPNFVLVTHHTLPKLTRFPTYGYVSASLNYYSQKEYMKCWMSWDGYLAPSHKALNFIDDICFTSGKLPPKSIFYNTSHISCDDNNQFFSTNVETLKNPSLSYVGMNWDHRYLQLLSSLSREKYFKIYGPEYKWEALNISAYCGKLPFTEQAVIDMYKLSGVGLALQSAYFVFDDVISNRIFEINSAGAVVITALMPFVEKYYGDSVLYFDAFASFKEIHQQIDAHMKWIKSNPELALEKALRAQKVFHDHLSIEKLLPNVIEYHKKSLINSGYLSISTTHETPEIAVIIRSDGENLFFLDSALEMLLNQTYSNIRPVFVISNIKKEGLEVIERYRARFNDKIDILQSDETYRSSLLWTGLKHVQQQDYPYFAVIDEGHELFPNHFSCLYKSLMDEQEKSKIDLKLVHSMWAWEKKEKEYSYCQIIDNRGITSVPLSHNKIKQLNSISLCSFLCKTSVLDDKILYDPLLNYYDGRYLQYRLAQKTFSIFNYRMTALIKENKFNHCEDSKIEGQYDLLRLKTHFSGQYFANGELIFDNFLTDNITYPSFVHKAHSKDNFFINNVNVLNAPIRQLIKRFLRPYKPYIIIFISKPMRLIFRVLRRIYYLQ